MRTEIYPDELMYSWIARSSLHEGYFTLREATGLFFEKPAERPLLEYCNLLSKEGMDRLTEHCTWEQAIIEHTMFPFYSHFLPLERKKKAWKAATEAPGDICNALPVVGGNRTLMYCPVCVEQDRKRYGETYFHRSAQIPFIKVCVVHKVRMKETDIGMKHKASPTLKTAEEACGDMTAEPATDLEIKLAQMLTSILDDGADMGCEYDVSNLLQQKMTKKGGSIDVESNYLRYLDLFGTADRVMSQNLFQRTVYGTCRDAYYIAQLAILFDISAEMLFSLSRNAERVDELCKNLSLSLRIPYDTVLYIAQKVRAEKKEKKTKKLSSEWEQYDEQMLPAVKDMCRKVYNRGGKPGMVTVKGIATVLSIPEKRFEKMPKCGAEIRRWKETSEQFWSRKIEWALNQLDDICTWRRIRNLTNIRPDGFLRAIPYIQDEDVRKAATKIADSTWPDWRETNGKV